MSEEKPDKVEIPIGDPYLEELDPELHRANQVAHEGMRACWCYYFNQARWGINPKTAYRPLIRALEEYGELCPDDSRTTEEEAD